MPVWDVRERHEFIVQAPLHIVDKVARALDIDALPLVRAIFWLRGKVMRSQPAPETGQRSFVARTQALGWGVFVDTPGLYISGAVTQPWLPDVIFTALPGESFATYDEPNQVKIVWTLEAYAAGPDLTVFASETRVRATDSTARRRFLRYWSVTRFGIVLIRLLVGRAIRRQAEALARAATARASSA
jgi:hypothetical protein